MLKKPKHVKEAKNMLKKPKHVKEVKTQKHVEEAKTC